VRLKLIDGVSTGLIGLAGQFSALNRHALATKTHLTDIERQMGKLKTMGLVGGAMLAAGGFGLSLFSAPLEEAKKFQTEVAKMSALGLGDKATSQAVQFAKGMNIMGQSARDNLKLVREATTIMGSLDHAMEVTPLLAKMKFGLQSVMGGEHSSQFEQMFQAALKTTELRGALINRQTGQIDVQHFSHVLNMMTQAYVASGGMVKPQDYLAAMKTGGVSAKLMNDEMFFYGLGHFMQESGGSRTGTSAMSMFQNIAMGRVSQQVAETWAKYGLLDLKHVHYGKTGHITKVDPMAVINAHGFTENSFKWMNETVVPLLQRKGLKGEDLNIALATLFGQRTAANMADQFVREQKVADLYITRAKRAADTDVLYASGSQTMQGKELDLSAKWKDVLNELGTTVLPIAIKAVSGLTKVLKGVIAFAREFPNVTKGLAISFAVLSGLVAVGGAVTLATAGFRALGLALMVSKGAGIGSMLLEVAGGVGGLALKLGQLGLLAGAGAAGYYGAKALGADAAGNWVGNKLAGWFQDDPMAIMAARDKAARDRRMAMGPSSFMAAGKSGQPINVHTQINLDGHKVASAVFKRAATELGRPQAGGSSYDPTLGLEPAGG